MVESTNSQMQRMLEPARERLKKYSVEELCRKGKLCFDEKTEDFLLPSMGEVIRVHYPDFVIKQELEMWHHLTLLQYMDTADGSSLAGTWVDLTQMRGGLARGSSFDREIAAIFENSFTQCTAEEFREACLTLGGEILPGRADITAKINYAPMFPVLVNFWEGDEEFAPSGKVLIDPNAEHYLTIEAAGGACMAVVRQIRDRLEYGGDREERE